MKRIAFISHSSKDKAIGEAVCNFLESHGIPCWIAPRDVTPGKNYGAAIVDAIDECAVFVLVLSGESNKSGQVVREVERAASTNSVIIPLRVEPVQPSRDLEFYVSSSHWLDATEKPLEKHLNTLVDAIGNWQTRGGTQDRATPEPPVPVRSAPARSGKRLLIGSAIVVALVLCASIIFFATRPRSKPRDEATPPPTASAVSPTPGESAASTNAPTIQRVHSSSQLKPQMYLGALRTYGPRLAFDGDEATAWVPSGSGPGEWIEVFFQTPSMLTSVSIYGGYGVDFGRYSTNNRVRELRMIFPNGGVRVLTLADKMQIQRFDLPHHPVVPSVRFEIVSIYRGSKYDSTPISEISFNRPE